MQLPMRYKAVFSATITGVTITTHIYLEATYNGQGHRLVSGSELRMQGVQSVKI